jgi:hypothetical protein
MFPNINAKERHKTCKDRGKKKLKEKVMVQIKRQ